MRQLLHATRALSWPSLRHTEGRLLGLPFVLVACAPGLLFHWSACIAALMLASVASFLVYVPMTALALNGGAALSEDEPAPPLTPTAADAATIVAPIEAVPLASIVTSPVPDAGPASVVTRLLSTT